ncbi:Protein of unknown function [Gryllus bimaculatus]|nr:Protein of unknown function [Gryllus bimaculatus]
MNEENLCLAQAMVGMKLEDKAESPRKTVVSKAHTLPQRSVAHPTIRTVRAHHEKLCHGHISVTFVSAGTFIRNSVCRSFEKVTKKIWTSQSTSTEPSCCSELKKLVTVHTTLCADSPGYVINLKIIFSN